MTYQLDDSNGNWLQNLGDNYERARKRAQEIANERGEAVSLYGGDISALDREEGEEHCQVFEPVIVTLSSYNTGLATEADFDAWIEYVCDHIDERCGFAVEVAAERFGVAGDDNIVGTDEQVDTIRDVIRDLWNDWSGPPLATSVGREAYRAHDQVNRWFGPVRASATEAEADKAARNAAFEAAGKLGTTFVMTDDPALLGAADDGRTDR